MDIKTVKLLRNKNNKYNILFFLRQKIKDIGIYNSDDLYITQYYDVDFIIKFIKNKTIEIYNISIEQNGEWLWDFGDNKTSNVRDPIKHTYERNDIYTIKLTYKSSNNIVNISKTIDINNTNVLFKNSDIIDEKNNISDFFSSPSNTYITGKTISYLNDILPYKKTSLQVGYIKNNKEIIDINENSYTYIDNKNTLRPITYIDNGDVNIFKYEPIGWFSGNTSYSPLYKKEVMYGVVEPIKITNNLTLDKNGSNVFEKLFFLNSKSSIGNIIKDNKFTIENF